jgi:hypothetical protein
MLNAIVMFLRTLLWWCLWHPPRHHNPCPAPVQMDWELDHEDVESWRDFFEECWLLESHP